MPGGKISVWVLDNQLSLEANSALRLAKRGTPVVMIESLRVAERIPMSKMRLTLVWSAMRHFSRELRRAGHAVDYHGIATEPSPEDEATYVDILRSHVEVNGTERLVVMAPLDWTMAKYVAGLSHHLGIEVEITPNTMLLAHGEEERVIAPDALARNLRRRYEVLVDAKGNPEGGQWHFEPEMRSPGKIDLPMPPAIEPDEVTQRVIETVEARFTGRVGDLKKFGLPVTRQDALAWLEHFVEHRLPHWAKYQDSTRHGRTFVAHSGLSPVLNLGLITPLEVVARIERAYRGGGVSLPSAVGVIRQIMGWREHVARIHMRHMPDHADRNFFEAKRSLPRFFWTGQTRCACLADALRRGLDTGMVNHTERLMVLGNYLLLIGVDPREATEWYLSVFVDAWEWCVVPNVMGLALWADGGLLTGKPYAASANYISKISDHCAHCELDHSRRDGPDACPFNYLYWNFIDRHRRRLSGVERMSRAMQFLGARDPLDLAECAKQTARHLEEIGVE